MENIKNDNGKYIMEFPSSCILYLRHTKNTKSREEIEIHFPEGVVFSCHVPVLKAQEYTKDMIFRKKLLFLLPFYVMRYEKEAGRIEADRKQLDSLLAEYGEIRKHLWKELGKESQGKELADLSELMIRISDYIFREAENARKGVEEIMGGQVLELQTDKAYAAGVVSGEARGEIKAYFKEGYSPEEIAEKAELPVEQVKKVLEELKLG